MAINETNHDSIHVRLKKVSKYFGTKAAVDDVSLDILEGKFTTLLGPSGCGKTTTLRLIAGIYTPDAGEILISGQCVNDIPPQKRSTAMVFQEYALFPHMNVYENVSYGLKRKKLPAREIQEKVHHVLEFLGLTQLGKRAINQLSGGQQQRVALARALVVEPSVLLLDEPLSNLDAKIRIKIRTELMQIQRSLGKTTIYVTHDQEEALSISDYIALMDQGRIIQFGTPQEIYYRPLNPFAADFIGNANFIRVRIRQIVDDGLVVELDGSTFQVPYGGSGFKANDFISMVVRPEALRLLDKKPDQQGGIKGIIKARSFMGGITRYWIAVRDMEWIADVPSISSRPPEKQEVWVEIDPKGLHVLRES